MITIVGVGPGHPSYITPAAIDCIDQAEVLIGGKRLLQAIGTSCKEVYFITGNIDEAIEVIENSADKETAVIVSGDPGFYSILKTIRERLPDLPVKVIPGISSVQLFFSLIGQEWQGVVFTSVHGRSIDVIDKALKDKGKICILTDDKVSVPEIGKYLHNYGLKGRAVIGKNLSYKDQELIDTTIDKLIEADVVGSCILYLEIGD